MDIIKWREDFASGVQQFDDEHKKLISLINQLHSGLVAGAERETLQFVLQELIQYTRKHFENEERNMRRFLYPEIDEHIKKHDSFRNTIEDLERMTEQGAEGLGLPLLKILRNWIVEHIVEVDGNYGSHFNEKGLT